MILKNTGLELTFTDGSTKVTIPVGVTALSPAMLKFYLAHKGTNDTLKAVLKSKLLVELPDVTPKP